VPSREANKYGTAVEYKIAEAYDLELARASWKDADAPDRTPVEIKAAMHEHADGQPARSSCIGSITSNYSARAGCGGASPRPAASLPAPDAPLAWWG
jgi:hypothetical protein